MTAKLTKPEQIALLDCVMFQPGSYMWKRKSMEKLASKGLAFLTASGAYSLTQAGADKVREIKEAA